MATTDYNSIHSGKQIDEAVSWALDSIENPVTRETLGAADASKLQYTMYRSLAELGLSGAVTIAEVCAAMPVYTMARFPNNTSDANHVSDVPGEYGTIVIWRVYTNYYEIRWIQTGQIVNIYYGGYHTTTGFSGWSTYLPMTGGRLTGNVYIDRDSEFSFGGSVNGYDSYYTVGEDGIVVLSTRKTGDNSNRVALWLGPETKSVDDLLRINHRVNNSSGTTYKVLHTGNMDKYIGATRMVAGTYSGTGKNGSSNPCTIECGFAPKAALIFRLDDGAEGEDLFAFFVHGQKGVQYGSVPGGDEYGYTLAVDAMASTTWGTTNLKWYNTVASGGSNSGEAQMNRSGATYGYKIWG